MNEDVLTPEDQLLLDRLVDGELSETERRELLLRLERSPDGWRRCALAFLEAQAWRGEAKALIAEPAGMAACANYAHVASAGRARQSWNGLTIWLPLATAAGFLLAVGYVKWFTPPSLVPGGIEPRVQIAADRSPASSDGMRPSPPADHDNAADGGNLRFVVIPGPGGERKVVEVPLVEAEHMNEALFGPWSQQLPPDIERLLKQSGNQVVRERRLVPIDLQDGRRVVVPMDQVEIRPVGIQAFQ